MKAAVLHQYDPSCKGPEFFSYDEVSDPTLQEQSDVIVRIGGAGLCRTELHIVEGIWQSKVAVTLPYTPGHENAGWIEETGKAVRRFKRGDAVIVHPLVTDGLCLACRRGNDMHCAQGRFPGIDSNGGFAQYLRVTERNLIPLADGLAPKQVAPYADAGLTAYHAAKKAMRFQQPGDATIVIGVGGLGHIAIQVLRALGADRIIAIDRSERALALARRLGADDAIRASKTSVAEAVALTSGIGGQVVMDFVAEGDTISEGLAMTSKGGFYFLVGYGGTISVPTIDMVVGEKSVIGNLVGTYAELQELMMLAARGKVTLTTRDYSLAHINVATADLLEGRIDGRAVLVP